MPTSNMTDFKWYRYTDDDGNFWSVKADKTWGDNAESGLAAFNDADPVFIKSRAHHPRYIELIEPATGRTTTRVVGTLAADAWSEAGYTLAIPVRGLATTVTFNRARKVREAIRQPRTIVSKDEVVTA